MPVVYILSFKLTLRLGKKCHMNLMYIHFNYKPALRAIAERGVYESYYFIGVQCNHLHHLAALSIKKRLGVVPTHFLGVGTFLELRDAC